MFERSKNIAVSGGTFVVHQTTVSTASEFLQKSAVPAALHDYVGRLSPPRCHENTRLSVLKEINEWIDLN
ncbi:hypothetical protein CVT26_005533 [Gymnopilus dilepis]|uniref:Uncharacterized protein n=1 Tax=Gymnopilus dilepis TaxID=231916 RepID=A0A409W8G1_9AGAR|nr:hypothetical protein CVT26_005533 [Gymnopilus dilepis]